MVVNSIEHAFKDIENPGIKFKLKKENNEITIEYFDNGIGYTFNTSKFIKNTGFLYFYSGITQTLKGTFKQISSPQGIHLIIQFTDGKKKSTFSRR
jgi:two-component sensor histidine kinase